MPIPSAAEKIVKFLNFLYFIIFDRCVKIGLSYAKDTIEQHCVHCSN